MANIYVKSSATSSPPDGLTWATAYNKLTEAASVAVAGDTIWVSHTHAESGGGFILTVAGTPTSPIRILCGNDSAEPPIALATTGIVESTGGMTIAASFSDNSFYMYGLTIRVGAGSTLSADLILQNANGIIIYDACTFHVATTNNASGIKLSSTGGFGESLCRNCHFEFSHISQGISITESYATISGGSVLAGTTPSVLFSPGSTGIIIVESFDMSNMASTMNLAQITGVSGYLQVRNCKLPASWSGSVNASTPGPGSIYELHNTDSTDTNYRYQRKTTFGIIDSERTIVRTSGASDRTTALSWKLVSNTNAQWSHRVLETSEISRWNDITGSVITVTVEILHDGSQGGSPSVSLTNKEIWLDVQYLGTSGFPLSLFASDAASSGSPLEVNYLGTETEQENSSATWTTTGMSNPVTQKLSVSFTAQVKGYIHAVVKLAKPSYTVYVDPLITIN